MTTTARTPWHFWPVAVVGLAWNAFGAYDYFMSMTVGAAYYRQMGMTDPQIAYMDAFPGWMTAIWATGVWCAFGGAVLLALRRRWSVPVLLLSLAAFLVSLLYSYLLSNGAEVMGDAAAMQFVVLAGCIFFAIYSWRQAQTGVLR
ncbi:hypothetical protein GCM10007973_08060 [Polymorphobacter multimanifer]|uniref:Membrane-bound acyltransferase YfiQ involved in biofilm formation n=1 Tax=Polymorphobacter multimanifer TaxID=1070431 RepID=A0A841L8L0_9SPHN|nr:hypothetical protein [Polymorphobacter multimanifer]MBB6228770.1 membrane-bound acyltransferase YfiQ involved in biofilm formation [Polymorphobacter multimanifer]GGI73562.1 hypothetical protein GCM10007973_08060 [Polymorphobacter multimanifer]